MWWRTRARSGATITRAHVVEPDGTLVRAVLREVGDGSALAPGADLALVAAPAGSPSRPRLEPRPRRRPGRRRRAPRCRSHPRGIPSPRPRCRTRGGTGSAPPPGSRAASDSPLLTSSIASAGPFAPPRGPIPRRGSGGPAREEAKPGGLELRAPWTRPFPRGRFSRPLRGRPVPGEDGGSEAAGGSGGIGEARGGAGMREGGARRAAPAGAAGASPPGRGA